MFAQLLALWAITQLTRFSYYNNIPMSIYSANKAFGILMSSLMIHDISYADPSMMIIASGLAIIELSYINKLEYHALLYLLLSYSLAFPCFLINNILTMVNILNIYHSVVYIGNILDSYNNVNRGSRTILSDKGPVNNSVN